MTCINKNNKNFKLAKARYGSSFAELAIRNISKSKGLIDDFYYPTIQEIKDYYKEEIKKKETLIFDALKNSTSLTLKTITDLLQGVIHKHNGIYFVTQGFGNNQSSIIRADNYTMIYRPNLEIIKKLEEMYPDIFSRTYVVKYTPPGASSNLSFVVENLNLKGREKIFDDYDLEVFKTPSKERNTILKIARIYRDVPLSIKRPFITRLTINPKLILTPVKEEVESEESLLNENLRTLGYRDRDLEVIQKEGQFISVTGNIYSSLQEALIDKDGQFEELFDPNNIKNIQPKVLKSTQLNLFEGNMYQISEEGKIKPGVEEGFKNFVGGKNLSNMSNLGKLEGDLMQSEKGQIGVNKQQLLMLLGPTMYNKPLAQVAVKELLQNSFDAVKARQNISNNKNTGNINIKVDYDNRTISIQDDGIGMTPDIVKNAFLSIGGTNKEGLDVSERSGGFGLAKVQFLLGSEYVKVSTVRDGIKTTLEASAIQLYNDDFEIFTEKTNESNGSFVEVKIPESYTTPEGTKREIDFPGRYTNNDPYSRFDILDKPLIGDVNIKFAWVKNNKTQDKVLPIGINSDETTLPPLFSKIDFKWGSADLYMSAEKKENPKHRILSSGIFQFSHNFKFKDWENIPYDIVVNIKPSVSSTSEQYPFNNQREGFKNTVQEDIKSLNNYLKKYASGEAEKDAKAVFSNITGLPKVDPNKVLTPEEREKLYADVEKTIEENKKRRIEQGLESTEEAIKKIYKLVIDETGVKNQETGEVEVSKEKNYGSFFKAEKEIEKVESIETKNFNPSLPQYHNNTNFDYLSIEGAAEFFSDFGSVVLEMVRFAGNELGYDYKKLKSEDEKFFAGVSIDKQYGGVHVRKIINAIFVNPLAFNVSSLEEAVGVALHVAIHEINHTTVSGEGAEFTTALGVLYGKIYATGKYGLYEGLFRSVYKKHFETFKKLKYEYDKSSTKNLSESFKGEQIETSSFRDVQRDVNDVSARQPSEKGYRGNQEGDTKDKTGDVILSNFISQDIKGFKEFVSKNNTNIKEGVEELFDSNPELANQVYSKILTNSGLSAENVLSLLLKDNIIEKQCS
jgi:hypothetical protein